MLYKLNLINFILLKYSLPFPIRLIRDKENHNTMKKSLVLTLLAIIVSVSGFCIYPIEGPSIACTGLSYHLTDSSFGGTWASSNTSVATIDVSSGEMAAISAGATTITYTYGGSYVTVAITVSPSPAPITETATKFCTGTSATCTDATTGGSWTSGNNALATVNASGVVTGVYTGIMASMNVAILYTMPSGCTASIADTVTSSASGSFENNDTFCLGSTGLIPVDTAGTSGGTWTSEYPAIATVDGSGNVTGITTGADIITYTVSSGGCGPAMAFIDIYVNSGTYAGVISGAASIVTGAPSTYSDPVSSPGTWSSSNTTVATIDPSTGTATGISAGTTTISYSVSGCGGVSVATKTVTVTVLDGISGHVFLHSGYYGGIRVWLITYNPLTLDLEASDSTTVYSSDTNFYYQFTGVSTDSFRVKAAQDSSYATSIYIPTYATNSFYWNSASVIYHTSGTSDLNDNIEMAYGATYSGPGFIGGNVTTGANKGTSTTIPAVGMQIMLINATTGTLLNQTYTDASGNYSFSNLPLGTYEIYPEVLNYATTPYTSISITSGTSTVSGASFEQHSLSKTITPLPEFAGMALVPAAYAEVYPNPTSGKIIIKWLTAFKGKGTIKVTDVAGREMYKHEVATLPGNGNSDIDLTGFENGIYIVTFTAQDINYSGEIQIQH